MKQFLKREPKLKTIEKSILIALILSLILPMLGFINDCENISKKVIRLHILANSDSDIDQNLKLRVRDRLLESSDIFLGRDVCTFDDAQTALSDRIKEIEEIAQKEVHEQGFCYNVHAQLADTYFSTRKYDDFTMPSGRYKALRITIGEGMGKNWWCVMFPPLCVSSAEDRTEIEDVLTEPEMDVLEEEYEVRFKIVEYLEFIKDYIFSWLNLYPEIEDIQ